MDSILKITNSSISDRNKKYYQIEAEKAKLDLDTKVYHCNREVGIMSFFCKSSCYEHLHKNESNFAPIMNPLR